MKANGRPTGYDEKATQRGVLRPALRGARRAADDILVKLGGRHDYRSIAGLH